MKNALAVAALLAASSAALADGVARLDSPYGGNPFRATLVSGYVGELDSSGTGFDTFCIEANEFFNPGQNYQIALSMSAINGGQGGGNPDPLSERTALMYRTFRDGGAFGASGSMDVGNAAEMLALQDAIWASEDEDGGYGSLSGLAKDLYDWAEANATAGNFYSVAIMNVRYMDGTISQDMLTIVPLPAAAWAGLGTLAMVLGTGYIRRRAQQA